VHPHQQNYRSLQSQVEALIAPMRDHVASRWNVLPSCSGLPSYIPFITNFRPQGLVAFDCVSTSFVLLLPSHGVMSLPYLPSSYWKRSVALVTLFAFLYLWQYQYAAGHSVASHTVKSQPGSAPPSLLSQPPSLDQLIASDPKHYPPWDGYKDKDYDPNHWHFLPL